MEFQRIDLPKEKIGEFCRGWKITELALFGSVLRDDFRPDSDIDVLVPFSDDCGHSLFELAQIQEQLKPFWLTKWIWWRKPVFGIPSADIIS